MQEFDGEYLATLEEYREVLEKVIQETFPSAEFILRVRQTKAMRLPKASVSLLDGPTPQDFAAAIPLLYSVANGVRWAYRGKVLPFLGWCVRSHPKSTIHAHGNAVWNQMQSENADLQLYPTWWGSPPKERPASCQLHRQRLSARMSVLHPQYPSSTMAEMVKGDRYGIVALANNQRRDNLALATPMATEAPATPRRQRL